jgi:hypothetical protein
MVYQETLDILHFQFTLRENFIGAQILKSFFYFINPRPATAKALAMEKVSFMSNIFIPMV